MAYCCTKYFYQRKKEAFRAAVNQSHCRQPRAFIWWISYARVDQLQLRLKQSINTNLSDNNKKVLEQVHRLEQLSPTNKIRRYQDRLLQLEKVAS